MLVARRALTLIVADLGRAADALGALARRHRDTAMAGRTVAVQAVPTTFGLKAAGWRHLVLDARDRLAAVLGSGLPVALGGAAGTLAGYLEYGRLDADADEDYPRRLVEVFAEETGLAVPLLPWHVLRTPIADLAQALGFAAAALGKVAVDVQLLARTETGEVAEPAPAGRGVSSAMPHKQNPVLATLMRSAALQVPHLAAGLTQCLIAEDERSAGAWHAEWQPLREALRLTGGAARAAAELAAGLAVHPRRMCANLDLTAGQVASERVAAHLAQHLGRGPARALLTRVSLEAHSQGATVGELLARDPGAGGAVDARRLEGLLDPTAYTGAARPLTDRALLRGAADR